MLEEHVHKMVHSCLILLYRTAWLRIITQAINACTYRAAKHVRKIRIYNLLCSQMP